MFGGLVRVRLAAVLLFTLIATIAPIGQASAAPIPPTVSARFAALPGNGPLSQAVRTPVAFSMVGFDVPAQGAISFRTSEDGEHWTPWTPAPEPELDEAPDPGTAEAARARRTTEPVWVREARYLQVRNSEGQAGDVVAHLVDGRGLNRSFLGRIADHLEAGLRAAPAAEAADRPDIVTREEWGADESLRNGAARYAKPRYAIVHHTAGRTDYTAEEAPAVVRAIYAYHTNSRGWDDVGYNFLVDKYGVVYEGRAGGIDAGVIGAHAAGFNTGSFGISVIGTYEDAPPPRIALDAVTSTIAWKQQVHGIDPSAVIEVTSGGSPRYPSGTKVKIPTTISHRDVGKTSCPGEAFFALMPTIRGTLRDGDAPPPPDVQPPADDSEAQPAPAPDAEEPEPAPAPPPPPPPPPVPFTDIDGDVHEDAIERLWQESVASGCRDDRFCPERAVTRGQIATFLSNVLDLDPVGGRRFSDVPSDHTHAGSINAIDDAGIVSGYPDGSFRPDDVLTRAQMAIVLQRALDLDLVWGQHFADVPMSETRARPRINAIHQAGIASGCTSTRYCPGDRVTRAQMATFLTRAFDL